MDSLDYIAEVEKHGGFKPAARANNIPETTFRDRYKKQKQLSAFNKLGLKIKDTEQVLHPDLALTGISQMVRTEDGIMWVKTNKEQQSQIDRFERIGSAILEQIKPRSPVKCKVKHESDEMLSCYILSDFHLGMFGYDGDWDTKIARDTLYKWVDHVVKHSLDSHTGLFLQLGDFFHANSSKPATPASGHMLDVDTHWEDVIEIGTEVLEYALERMLEKHEHVHFINAEANHDPDAAKWVQRWFERLYRDNPRLSVDCTKGGYYAYQWGDTSIFAHHGHAKGLTDVSKVLTAMYPEIFGATKHRYAHLGHFHHAKRRPMGDDGLMDVQIHTTLAAKDQYAVTRGYVSSRGARTEFYHKRHGHIGGFTVPPSLLGV